MANPYKDRLGAGAAAKMKRMLGQGSGKNVGKFADAPASEAEIKRFTGGYDIRMPGGVEKSKTRLDRYARGGRTKDSKKKGHTTVNVLVGGHGAPQPSPGPMPVPPGRGGGLPVPPPAPPMPPPGAMAGGMPPPGGMPPGMPPPGMGAPGMMPRPPMPGMPAPGMPGMPRKRGGKVVGDRGPASGKNTPLDKGKRGQSGWNVPRVHKAAKKPERNTRG